MDNFTSINDNQMHGVGHIGSAEQSNAASMGGDDYEDFFQYELIGKLCPPELDDVLPILVETQEPDTVSFLSIHENWRLHALPLILANEWLEQRYYDLSPEVAIADFLSLSSLQKAIIQRGYEIKYEEAFPPIFDGTLYCVRFQLRHNYHLDSDFIVEQIPAGAEN